MLKEVHNEKVSQLFPKESRPLYEIPKYQREFTWKAENIEQLFNDVIGNDDGYFLGSFISIQVSEAQGKCQLIDGQQRFITLSLMLLALYNEISSLNDSKANTYSDDLNLDSIRQRLVYNIQGVMTRRLTLQTQGKNDADYVELLGEAGLIDKKKSDYSGNRRIVKGYKTCSRVIKDYLLESKEFEPQKSEIDTLFALVSKFLNAQLTHIYVSDAASAYLLFEAINNRGVPLSPLDLIKNSFISKALNDDEADSIYDKWQRMLGNLGEDAAVHERFLIHYYNSFIRKPKIEENEDPPTTANKPNVIKVYEDLVRDNYRKVIDDLVEKSQLYAILINNSDNETFSAEITDLMRIQAAPSYQLLLYLLDYKNQVRDSITDDDFKDIVKSIVIFSFRRSMTGDPSSRKMIDIYLGITDSIKLNKAGKDIANYIKKCLAKETSDDDDLKKALLGNVYKDNKEATRFILCYIEKDNKEKPDLWTRDSKTKKPIWTIEHIFPEGENIPKHWVDMMASGDEKKAKEYLETYCHKLGNLSMTAYNPEMSNKSFEEKLPYYQKNNLWLSESIVDKTKWTTYEIDSRTTKIVERILEIMSLE